MNKYYDAASWLLTEDEDEDETSVETEVDTDETETTDAETDETETDETGDTTETDDAGEDIVDAEDVNPDETDIADRLDAIETKLDDLKAAQEAPEEEYFDLDLANPVCPHCGAHLRIADDSQETGDLDDQIINGTYGETGDEDGDDTTVEDIEGTGEDIDVSGGEDAVDLDVGTGEDYVNFDDIVSSITDDDEEDDK